MYKTVYFQFKDPAGYVIHGETRTYKQTFWISVGPLITNSLLAIMTSFIAFHIAEDSITIVILLWVTFSVGSHAFPSNHDMSHIYQRSKRRILRHGHIIFILAFPFVWLVWLANKLRLIWFDAIYAILLIGIGSGFFW